MLLLATLVVVFAPFAFFVAVCVVAYHIHERAVREHSRRYRIGDEG